MRYNHKEIEEKWQKYWALNETFKAQDFSSQKEKVDTKPKYYVLDMFPYPSGAGLHVGHPLGYIASDIVARYKRHKGFNVLHPQGYDSFGLPAEQYAIQTGQHPEKTTKANIERYRKQLDRIGFSFDWSNEIRTSDPKYYKHTQWIFIQLFQSWYNKKSDKAEDISSLISEFENCGNHKINAVCDEIIEFFSAIDWKEFSENKKQQILLKYRLAYLAETEVNWCPALGTVLANDEIVNGVSERGGHAVLRKQMTQWSMRISAYAERLLNGLETIDWSDSIKETQRNWIGKSAGALITFKIKSSPDNKHNEDELKLKFVDVFSTRPDTLFGVTFLTLAPEHQFVKEITTEKYKKAVENYIDKSAKKSERERMADVKTISGVFTGAFALHPFTNEAIPIWIGDYVLNSYGTGAVMAVPAGDDRDFAFAKHFNLPIKNIFNQDVSLKAFTDKNNFSFQNSDFLNGLDYKEATKRIIAALENINQGKSKINYRLRDAVFSRQRYWGEPIPVYYKKGVPYTIPVECLPLKLPEVENYLPTQDGQSPLANAKMWAWDTQELRITNYECINETNIFKLETDTMPGWAGSSWYWMRYMDVHNSNKFASEEALKYWQSVDLYVGGSEHATGHLLYSRFWNKFLKDKGFAPTEEPFKKLINQGMILGMSAKIKSLAVNLILNENTYLIKNRLNFYSKNTFQDNNEWFTNDKLEEEIIKEIIEDIPQNIDLIFDNNKSIIDLLKNKENSEIISFLKGKLILKAILFHVDISLLEGEDNLNMNKFLEWRKENKLAFYHYEKFKSFKVSLEVEKMSKSKFNVVNPDDICNEYGADTLRLYEMFLGPLEQSKPWNTAGISGVFGFLKKLWRLYFDENGFIVTENKPSNESLKTLHKTIKKIAEDIENFSFNTSVSQFMICVNELQAQNCHERTILEPLAILISPFAPHISEELWYKLGDSKGISYQEFPIYNEKYLVETNKDYPVSFNGKMRFTINLPLDLSSEEVQKIIINDERTIKYLDGNQPKKIIIVYGKVINLVV